MRLRHEPTAGAHRLASALFAVLAVGCAPASMPLPAAPISIIPRPRTLEPGAGVFHLRHDARIAAPADLVGEATLLASHWERPLEVGGSGEAAIRLAIDPTLASEGYVLDVDPSGVAIRGGSPAGVFWGIQTLLLLLPPSTIAGVPEGRDVEVPVLRVEDAPRFAHRGLLFDEARWFFGAETVRRMIDWMALHKLNVLHWHLTDDQGWRIPIPTWPRLTEVGAWRAGSQLGEWFDETMEVSWVPEGGSYTREELVAIVAYAAARHITIVPEIDLPGHTVAALAAYPELACTDGPFSVSPYFIIHEDVLCVCEPVAMRFAQDVLREVMEIFPSEVIHVGGDEVPPTRWQESADCVARASELGLGATADLHGWYVAELARFLESNGRRAAVWNEAFSRTLPPSAIVQVWRGDWRAETEGLAIRGDVIVSPAEETYLNRTYARIPMTTSYAFDPVPASLDPALAARVLGLEACMWTPWDGTLLDIEQKMFPRMAAYAEVGWTDAALRDAADFDLRLPAMRARYEALGIRQTR